MARAAELAAEAAGCGMKAILNCDGGARGNPGPAGIGFVLAVTAAPVIYYSQYVGETTNNVAEYRALIAGLKRAQQSGVTEVEVRLDSELVVRQMKGEYRVKDDKLKPLFAEAQRLTARFQRITFQHVPREKNARADALVNKAIDKTQKDR